MNKTVEQLAPALKEKNIRLSHQRLKVLEYLSQNHIHPTADQIYQGLHQEVPTLSKTTVYNTLNALVEAGIVRPVLINEGETRYDILTEDHGHFRCAQCGKIINFTIDPSLFYTAELAGFKIQQRDVFFSGLCPHCRNQSEKE